MSRPMTDLFKPYVSADKSFRIMCRLSVYFYTFRNKLSVPLTVVIIIFSFKMTKKSLDSVFVISIIIKVEVEDTQKLNLIIFLSLYIERKNIMTVSGTDN